MKTAESAIEQLIAPPPGAILMQLLFSPLLQQSICIAAKLKIADLVVQPKTIYELASLTQTNQDALYRVLRMLVSVGIFNKNEEGKFELTSLASLLRSDLPDSMYSFAVMMGEDWLWRNWGELMHCVKTGGTAQQKVHGMSSFKYFSLHPNVGTVFNQGMNDLSNSVLPSIIDAYDFSPFERVADIAGGHGMLLAGILKANPDVKGVLFELPGVIEEAKVQLQKEGMLGRIDLIPGDFLQFIPKGADVYLMKHIIHDWDDETNTKILKNIQSVMNEDSKLLVIEMVVPEGNEPCPSKILDLQMLIMEGGKERTKDEYGKLLKGAGLKLTRIIPTKSPYSIIEARRG